ncbi:hypothetical protein TNCV_2594941 [Trichonephila clavipes]|nr:hypothetical protein TNCV_2594941 [Trichonephila clavipes]
MNLTWRNPPAHHWYAAKSPGLSIQCRSSRAHQPALARFRSGPPLCVGAQPPTPSLLTHSPDLDRIENVWDMMERRVRQHSPFPSNLRPKKLRSQSMVYSGHKRTSEACRFSMPKKSQQSYV